MALPLKDRVIARSTPCSRQTVSRFGCFGYADHNSTLHGMLYCKAPLLNVHVAKKSAKPFSQVAASTTENLVAKAATSHPTTLNHRDERDEQQNDGKNETTSPAWTAARRLAPTNRGGSTMTTVSLGVKDTLAKMLDAVPAKKRQFLNTQARVTHPFRQKTKSRLRRNRRVVVVDRCRIARVHHTCVASPGFRHPTC